MKKTEENDQQEFQILLSKEDYNELKSWKNKFILLEKKQNQIQNAMIEQRDQKQQKLTDIFSKYSEQIKKKDYFKQNILKCWNLIKIEIQRSNLKTIGSQTLIKFLTQTIKFNSEDIFLHTLTFHNELRNFFEKVDSFITNINSKKQQIIFSLTKENCQLKRQIDIQKKKSVSLEKENDLIEEFRNNDKLKSVQLHQSFKKEFQQREKILKNQYSNLQNLFTNQKKSLEEIKKQNDLLNQTNEQFEIQNKQLQDNVKELEDDLKQQQQHIKILKQSIKIQSRSKLSNQNQRKSIFINHNKSSKFQKEDYVKETLVEYARQIKKNLISIGNLSHQEIRQIGSSQLNTLIKFIKELQEDFE